MLFMVPHNTNRPVAHMSFGETCCLVGGLEHFLFSHILGISSQMTNIFQRGWNHQPVVYGVLHRRYFTLGMSQLSVFWRLPIACWSVWRDAAPRDLPRLAQFRFDFKGIKTQWYAQERHQNREKVPNKIWLETYKVVAPSHVCWYSHHELYVYFTIFI